MQTTYAWGLLSFRVGNNDVKKKREQKENPLKASEAKKKRQKISRFYKEGTKVQ